MSRDLAKAADHYRRMADADHRPDCHVEWAEGWDIRRRVTPNPDCPGCVTDTERDQWRRLADEAERHLADTTDTQEETLL